MDIEHLTPYSCNDTVAILVYQNNHNIQMYHCEDMSELFRQKCENDIGLWRVSRPFISS